MYYLIRVEEKYFVVHVTELDEYSNYVVIDTNKDIEILRPKMLNLSTND